MNEKIAIQVTELSKKYTIGKNTSKNTLRELMYSIFNKKKSKATDFWALSNLNFKVNKGEVIGVIGNNGAGKSTLLKVLSQITKPTSGLIEINGRIASLLEVGTGFHPELTGRENIFLNGTILGMSRSEVKAKYEEIVEFSGVKKFIDTPVKNYSSGMYVRLAFAVAAHLEPEILIIDEVLAVGDAEFQKKCLGKMKEVAGNGRTVIFVSHDLGMIQNLCSRCYLLDNGKIIKEGATMNVTEFYKNLNQHKSQLDRKKSESLYFTNISIHDITGNNKSIFDFNESIVIRGKFVSDGTNPKSMQLCIVLLDRNGRRVFSEIKNIEGDKKGECNFRLELPIQLIAPNFYSFLFQLYVPPGNLFFDQMENVLPIEIIDNGSKLIGYKDFGAIVLSNSIELTPN